MNHILFDNSNKLRSGWRAGIFLFVFFFVSAFFNFLSVPYSLMLPRGDYWVKMHFLTLSNAFMLAEAIIFGAIAAKVFEGLPFSSLGARCQGKWLRHFFLGILFGSITLTFAVLIAFVFGGERFELNLSGGIKPVVESLLISFGIFAIASAFEEAFFRGYIFQTFARSGLAWLAIVLTSSFFGAVHLANLNSTAISTFNTTLAGVWFGLAYLKTRDLWFVWGLHLMWNWMQGSIFGIEVSGLTDITTSPLFREIDTGPTWLTGSGYGIEGGIACTIALIVSTGAIHYMPGRINHIETLNT